MCKVVRVHCTMLPPPPLPPFPSSLCVCLSVSLSLSLSHCLRSRTHWLLKHEAEQQTKKQGKSLPPPPPPPIPLLQPRLRNEWLPFVTGFVQGLVFPPFFHLYFSGWFHCSVFIFFLFYESCQMITVFLITGRFSSSLFSVSLGWHWPLETLQLYAN